MLYWRKGGVRGVADGDDIPVRTKMFAKNRVVWLDYPPVLERPLFSADRVIALRETYDELEFLGEREAENREHPFE